MSKKVDEFCEKLRHDLTSVEDRLSQIKQQIDRSGKETRSAIEAKLGEAKAKVEAQKKEADEALAKVKSRIEEKKSETHEKIEEWKTNRELHKLEKRADRAEEYAAACIIVAADSVTEADLATLEAFDARMLAEEFSDQR